MPFQTKKMPPAKKAVEAKVATKDKKKRKKSKSPRINFSTYIYRVLKETHPTIGITRRSMGIMNDFCIDMMEKLASEAKQDLLLSGKAQKTLREWHFNTATKLILPGELKKHGVGEGTKAVRNYESNKTKAAAPVKRSSPK
ncbi:hypothetical protein ACHAXA_005853 [Cyclostephanos tholiformis]|uniref:Core Histone H2A/H2B/H3 domain-containing protein n=1 Tax=Cyclostephanos tholiformis TaxID=382380 RepID=A0ABD3RDF5_9STRA